MSILGLVGLAKVALLHDGGEGRHVRDGRFGRGGVVVLLEDLHVLVEDALVVIFLEESLLAALFLLARLFRSLRVLLDAQFFRQGTARFDFLADLFERVAGFSVSFETSQLAQFPRFKLAFGVEAIRVVHVGVNLLRLLRGNLANDTVGDEGFRFLPPFPVLFLALRFESFRVELLLSLGDRIAVPFGDKHGFVDWFEGLFFLVGFFLRVGLVLARLLLRRSGSFWSKDGLGGRLVLLLFLAVRFVFAL